MIILEPCYYHSFHVLNTQRLWRNTVESLSFCWSAFKGKMCLIILKYLRILQTSPRAFSMVSSDLKQSRILHCPWPFEARGSTRRNHYKLNSVFCSRVHYHYNLDGNNTWRRTERCVGLEANQLQATGSFELCPSALLDRSYFQEWPRRFLFAISVE